MPNHLRWRTWGIVAVITVIVIGVGSLLVRRSIPDQVGQSPTVQSDNWTGYETRTDEAIRITEAARATGASDQNACFSPDGSEVVFTRFKQGYNRGPTDLVLLTLATGKERVLVGDGEHDHVNVPGSCWSGATNQIVFASDRSETGDQLYRINVDGSDPRKLTAFTDDRPTIEPVISPDGTLVAFERDEPSSEEDGQRGAIWTIGIGGTGLAQLTGGPDTDDRLPNWSPTGELLFQRRRTDSPDSLWDVWVTKRESTSWSAPRNVTGAVAPDSNETDNAWFPNGRWIVSSSDFGGIAHPKLFAFPIDGGQPVRLTNDSNHEDGAPSVSPDGQSIAFESHRTSDENSPSDLWIIQTPMGLR